MTKEFFEKVIDEIFPEGIPHYASNIDDYNQGFEIVLNPAWGKIHVLSIKFPMYKDHDFVLIVDFKEILTNPQINPKAAIRKKNIFNGVLVADEKLLGFVKNVLGNYMLFAR